MKNRLFRWENCFLPAACLIGALLGHETLALRFMVSWLLVSLTSLCADGAFCIAATRQSSFRKLDRCFCGAYIQLLIGILPAVLVSIFLENGKNAWMIGAAVFFGINQLCVEALHAYNRRKSACIAAFLHALLLLLGFILNHLLQSIPVTPIDFAMVLGLGISELFIIFVPFENLSIAPPNYACAPRAIWQNLLYPAAVCGACWAHGKALPVSAIAAGWMLWRGARTVCRRSESESAPLNFWITAITGAAIIAALFLPQLMWVSACLTLAMLCSAIVFAHFSVRIAMGAALLIGAQALSILHPLPQTAIYIICSVLSIAAPLTNLRHAFLKRI